MIWLMSNRFFVFSNPSHEIFSTKLSLFVDGKLCKKVACFLQNLRVAPLFLIAISQLRLLFLFTFQLLIHLLVNLLDIHFAILIVEPISDLDDARHVDIPEFLYKGQNVDKIVVHYCVSAIFENGHTAAVKVKITPISLERQHHVPQLYCFIKPELLSKQQGQPTKAIVLRKNFFSLKFQPQLVVDNFEKMIQQAHPSHDTLLGFVHVFDMHVDQEGHKS